MGEDYSGMGTKVRLTTVIAMQVLLLLAPVPARTAETTADAAEQARTAVADHFNKGANPEIQQAAWSSRSIFNVGVHYMGADQSAIADDVCPVLSGHGVTGNIKVRVIDINTMGRDQKRWEVVGQASCR
jgi:purine nucleoside permease